MNEQRVKKNQISRRRFVGYSAAAAAFSMTPGIVRASTRGLLSVNPDSVFGGVPIGAITYSFRSLPGTNAADTLEYLVKCGLSSCELMSGPVEESAGAPKVDFRAIMAQFPRPEPDTTSGEGQRRFQMSP